MSKKVHKKIPVIREALADLDTPLSVYLKLANEPFTYLLESAQVGSEDGGKWDRYSIIGMRCPTRIRVVGTQIDVFNDDQNGEITIKEFCAFFRGASSSIHARGLATLKK